MNDKELLELAAKAAGINWRDWTRTMFSGEDKLREWPYDWNPLINDGDALRLAILLRMKIHIEGYGASCRHHDNTTWYGYEAHLRGGIEAATRRAIVRAAASFAGKAS